MLGLVYLTSVAGLIATSAVMQQLTLSRYGQTPLQPTTDISLAHHQNFNLKADAPSEAQHLPCCVPVNNSLNHPSTSPGINHAQSPPSASSQTSLLCVWGSLLASMGHIHPETNSEMEATWSPTSLFCPGCLASLPLLHCGLRNNSALTTHGPVDNQQCHRPWLASSFLGGIEPGLNFHLPVLPPVHPGPCHPHSLLAINKAQALLMPG